MGNIFFVRNPKSLFFVLLILLVFWGGFQFGKRQGGESEIANVVLKDLGKSDAADFSIFWDAWRVLEQKSFQREFDPQKMIYGAVSGMVKSLGDPYTIFLPPQEAKKFEDDISGSFEGIGAEIGIRKDQLVIIAPLEDTPASRAGLRSGDKIFKIDDVSTADLAIDEAVNLIRGPHGTKVTLLIFRDDWEAPKPIDIIRDVIQIPTLKLEFKESGIAVIKLHHFNDKAAREFSEAVQKMRDRGVGKIILDLRNNPGGFLEISQEIAGWFVPRGEIVVTEDFGGKKPNIEYRSKGNASLQSMPIIILVNEGSASASEILAGALRDHLNVKLVGEKTFGKGSVQELEKLRDGSSLKITVAKWLTPKGTLINDKGLEPDVKIEMKPEDIDAKKDPQLEKAIEILRQM